MMSLGAYFTWCCYYTFKQMRLYLYAYIPSLSLLRLVASYTLACATGRMAGYMHHVVQHH